MYLQKLVLRDYRNFEALEFTPIQGLNIITGYNAQGKTNLAEAVYLTCTARSHRTSRDSELIRFGAESAYVGALTVRRDGRHSVQIGLSRKGGKALKINGIQATRLGELMGHSNAVIFSPEDLQLVRGAPLVRRRFMDMTLCQTDRMYFYELQNYQKALAARNALLKGIIAKPSLADTLDVWDEQLARFGAELTLKRRALAEALAQTASQKHRALCDGSELAVQFRPSAEGTTREECAEELRQKLLKNRASDIRQSVTGFGPHRDDLVFFVDGYELKGYGSQGQNRSVALSLRLAELEIMERAIGEKPMLILDDVLSELDTKRRHGLLGAIGDAQTFVTCVNAEDDLRHLQRNKALYNMDNGKLTTL